MSAVDSININLVLIPYNLILKAGIYFTKLGFDLVFVLESTFYPSFVKSLGMYLLIRSTLAYTFNTSWKNFHPPNIFGTIRSDWTLVLLLSRTNIQRYNLLLLLLFASDRLISAHN